jgi:antitoxin VapB
MSLNIKSPEAHELAAELARVTGESMAKAVTEALRERLEREKGKHDEDKLFAELMAIADQCAAYPRREDRSLEEFLYDERGLPRDQALRAVAPQTRARAPIGDSPRPISC